MGPQVQVEMYKSLNSTQVLMASIFDALVQQRDRNTGNAFVSEDGQVSLIDNDKVRARSATVPTLVARRFSTYILFPLPFSAFSFRANVSPTHHHHNAQVLSEGENSIFLSNTAYYLYNIFGREYVRYNGYNISAVRPFSGKSHPPTRRPFPLFAFGP